MKWEFKSVIINLDGANKLGEEGWELVSVTPEHQSLAESPTPLLRFTFKRPLKEDEELLKEG